MTILNEAISLENFQRAEKGLPPIKVKKEPRPEPERPTVEDEIEFTDIPETELFEFSARRRVEKNAEGVRFSGYSVFIEGRDGKQTEGWMIEGEFMKLKQRIEIENSSLLLKIGL